MCKISQNVVLYLCIPSSCALPYALFILSKPEGRAERCAMPLAPLTSNLEPNTYTIPYLFTPYSLNNKAVYLYLSHLTARAATPLARLKSSVV